MFAQPGILQHRAIYSSLSHPSWVWDWEQPRGAGDGRHKGLAGLWGSCCKPQQPRVPLGQQSRAPAPSCFSARSQPVHADCSVVASSSCPVVPLGGTRGVPSQDQSCQLLYVRFGGRCPGGMEYPQDPSLSCPAGSVLRNGSVLPKVGSAGSTLGCCYGPGHSQWHGDIWWLCSPGQGWVPATPWHVPLLPSGTIRDVWFVLGALECEH